MKSWYLLWILLVLSEISTAIMDVFLGKLWRDKIDRDLIIIGVDYVFVVSFIVSIILISSIREIRKHERSTLETVRLAE
ncbi:MAG TPA: hypothetical protein VEE82_02160 [Thermodesulfovibrionales bacterium]|nr:hypothetical protein [Thermodesulfovibrionales bacterium]